VTPDELPNRDDQRLRCSLDGRVLQDGRTRDMIFSVPELVAGISAAGAVTGVTGRHCAASWLRSRALGLDLLEIRRHMPKHESSESGDGRSP
jgi:hypothetical protein